MGVNTCRAIIVTPLSLELNAVLAHLSDESIEEIEHSTGKIYLRGRLRSRKANWDLLIAEIGMGDPTAAQETQKAIDFFRPQIVILIGVAGGIKDVRLGDVVFGTKVYYYEPGKLADDDGGPVFQPRPDLFPPAYRLLERARAEGRSGAWLDALKGDYDQEPKVFFSPIASGEKVVASSRSDVYQRIRNSYSDAVAVEMEGYGVLRAVFSNPGIEAMVVRGVSDLIDDKAKSDSKGWQEKAAKRASAFAFQVLSKIGCHSSLPLGPQGEREIAAHASRIEVDQDIDLLEGRAIAAEIVELTSGSLCVKQNIGTIADGGDATALSMEKATGGEVKAEQKIKAIGPEGKATALKLDKI